MGLEDSMRQFERGVSLLRRCYQVLEQAEQRIEILTKTDEQGNPVLSEFDASATIDQPKKSAGRRRKKAAKPTTDDAANDGVDDDSEEADDTLF